MTELVSDPSVRRTGLGRRVADVLVGAGASRYDAAVLGDASVVPLDAVPVPFVVSTPDGRALAINQRWLDAAGWSRRDASGTGWFGAYEPGSARRLERHLEWAAGQEQESSACYAWSGRPAAPVRWQLAPFSQGAETLVAVAMTGRDQNADWMELVARLSALVANLDALLDSLNAYTMTVQP